MLRASSGRQHGHTGRALGQVAQQTDWRPGHVTRDVQAKTSTQRRRMLRGKRQWFGQSPSADTQVYIYV